jgi:hypothetical protein
MRKALIALFGAGVVLAAGGGGGCSVQTEVATPEVQAAQAETSR